MLTWHEQRLQVITLDSTFRRELPVSPSKQVVIQDMTQVIQSVPRVFCVVSLAACVDKSGSVRVGHVSQGPCHDLPQLRVLVAECIVLVGNYDEGDSRVIDLILVLAIASKGLLCSRSQLARNLGSPSRELVVHFLKAKLHPFEPQSQAT